MEKRGAGFVAAIIITIIAAAIAVGGYLALSGEGTHTAEEGQNTATYENIAPREAKVLIDSRTPIILDVRTPDEFENGHIPNAVLVPIDELENSTFLKIPKDEEILVYCRSGHRSSWGAEYLSRIGYSHVYNLSGGILAWENQGYPVIEARDVEDKPTCRCVVLG